MGCSSMAYHFSSMVSKFYYKLSNVGVTEEGKLIGVQEIVTNFWEEYGRNFYSRYDYEEVNAE